MKSDDDLRIRPGRIRTTRSQRAKPFIAQALAPAEKAGGMARRSSATTPKGTLGRGRAASLAATREMTNVARRGDQSPRGSSWDEARAAFHMWTAPSSQGYFGSALIRSLASICSACFSART
jgi:hypothetical protein